jgi:site-specific DNA-methyltransferase (adenine-specific)/modification methylase
MSTPERVVIGNATLIHGDCREVLPLLPPCDLILTDPPYGIGADRNLRANKQHGKAAVPSKDYGAGDWDNEPPPVWLVELMRAKSTHQILWGGNYYNLPPAVGWLVWDKENGENCYADCELAWSNLPQAIRRLKYRWAGMLQQDMANKEVREHPTQKPVPLMRWSLMQAAAAQTVCDPFMGSGTTGVACALEGRKFTGIERERKYFDIAVERISRAQAQGTLLPPEEAPQPVQQNLV